MTERGHKNIPRRVYNSTDARVLRDVGAPRCATRIMRARPRVMYMHACVTYAHAARVASRNAAFRAFYRSATDVPQEASTADDTTVRCG